MLENTEGAIENGQSKETGKIGYTRRKQKAKQKTPLARMSAGCAVPIKHTLRMKHKCVPCVI